MPTLQTWDGEVLEVQEYMAGRHADHTLARCVIATPSGAFIEWRYVDDIRIEVA